MTLALLTVLAVLQTAVPRVVVICGQSPEVSPQVLAVAQREAQALFSRDEIEIQWGDFVENDPAASHVLVVLFSRSSSYPIRVSHNALGVTFLDSRRIPRRVSVLFLDRLRRVAGRPLPEYLGRALGRAMAHEIGHGLLEKNQHSPTGLLREAIGWRFWTAAPREPFYLAPSDAETIRSNLAGGTP